MSEGVVKVRLFLNLCVAISILFLPWWFTLALIVLLLAIVEAWEVLLWGVLFDVLYASPVPLYGGIPLIATITCTLLFFGIVFLKRRLIFY